MRVSKREIKDQINEFCLGLYQRERVGVAIGHLPIALVVYIGQKSYDVLYEEVEGSFRSLLNEKPKVESILLTERNIGDAEAFREAIRQCLRNLNDEGFLISGQSLNIQLAFVGLMEDPVFQQKHYLDELKGLKSVLDDMGNMLVSFGNISFYGIFDQNKDASKWDYGPAFSFVLEGNDSCVGLWKQVYHLQKSFIVDSYEKECRAVAMKILYDSMFRTTVIQTVTPDGNYIWNTLGMTELKMPEQVLCNILKNAYDNQLKPGNLTAQEEERLEKGLKSGILAYIDNECEVLQYEDMVKYLPQYAERVQVEEKKGFLGSLFGKGGQENISKNRTPVQNRIRSEELVEVMLNEYLQPLEEEITSEEIMLKLIYESFHVLNCFPSMGMEDVVIKIMQQVVLNLECAKQQLKWNMDVETMDAYRSELFTYYATRKKYDLAKAFLQKCLEQEGFKKKIAEMIHQLKEEIGRVGHILDDLRINDFGGSVALELPVLLRDFEIPIHTGIKEACNRIQDNALNEIVTNPKIVVDNLSTFLVRSSKEAENTNSIGRIRGEFSEVPTMNQMLLSANEQIDAPGIMVKSGNLFRPNTLQMLATGEWKSQRNLMMYFKEEGNE